MDKSKELHELTLSFLCDISTFIKGTSARVNVRPATGEWLFDLIGYLFSQQF